MEVAELVVVFVQDCVRGVVVTISVRSIVDESRLSVRVLFVVVLVVVVVVTVVIVMLLKMFVTVTDGVIVQLRQQ